ncbi:hypothetical protein GUJ93_ZPchr0008g13124 [Zizania palustris]|uniref:Uncharacterized protein n=1 Tax=Zizania palustris TaxID=103762 RepID=A0A8J5R8Z4_ZIZPA|nr:hypothetical protein GUJ93_ZPchr0008g13124 [Zizania palustris]
MGGAVAARELSSDVKSKMELRDSGEGSWASGVACPIDDAAHLIGLGEGHEGDGGHGRTAAQGCWCSSNTSCAWLGHLPTPGALGPPSTCTPSLRLRLLRGCGHGGSATFSPMRPGNGCYVNADQITTTYYASNMWNEALNKRLGTEIFEDNQTRLPSWYNNEADMLPSARSSASTRTRCCCRSST